VEFYGRTFFGLRFITNLNFGHWNLPFGLAQGGELVEPFGFCDLLFEICRCSIFEFL